VVPADGVDHAPTTDALSPGPPISVPVPKQLDSASGRGLETQPTVSDQAVLMIVVANY
jgi:hypothetical protein